MANHPPSVSSEPASEGSLPHRISEELPRGPIKPFPITGVAENPRVWEGIFGAQLIDESYLSY